MKRDRSGFEQVLIAAVMLGACAAGVMAQTVPIEGTADVSGLQTQLDAQQEAIDSLRADVDALLDDATTPPDPEPQTPDPILGGTSGGDKPTDLWLGVSHFGPVPAVTAKGNHEYDIDDRFVSLMGQWSGIRYLDWGGLKRWGVNRSWADRVNDDITQDKPTGKRWRDLAQKWNKTGVPLEAVIETANRTKTHVWWCGPIQADTEFYRQAGRLFAERLDPELNVVIEVGNEVWDASRGKPYYDRAGGDFGEAMRLYARDAAAKFAAFESGGFPKERLTRVVGGQLHNLGVLKSNVLKHLADGEYDAITVSGYFGNSQHLGQDWRTGRHGLNQSLAALQAHGELARSVNKQLLIYELNQHIQYDLGLVDSDPVIAGVRATIDTAKAQGASVIAIYAGAGDRQAPWPWPIYLPDLTPRRIVTELGWPTLNTIRIKP